MPRARLAEALDAGAERGVVLVLRCHQFGAFPAVPTAFLPLIPK